MLAEQIVRIVADSFILLSLGVKVAAGPMYSRANFFCSSRLLQA